MLSGTNLSTRMFSTITAERHRYDDDDDERDDNNAISKPVNFGLLMRGLNHDDHNDHDTEL